MRTHALGALVHMLNTKNMARFMFPLVIVSGVCLSLFALCVCRF